MRFDFNLSTDAPGWAHPVVEINGETFRMTAGYTSDALGDLLNALIGLLNGDRQARCVWEQEPGHWIWDLWRPDGSDVRLQLIFHKDAFLSMSSDFDPKVVTEVVIPLAVCIEAIASGARRCLDKVGPEGFVEQWHEHAFPQLQLEALEAWTAAGATAPIYEPSHE